MQGSNERESRIKGYWLPLLHAHLPYVKHPEYDCFLEESWLFEAISESYIPLLMNMKKMYDEGIGFGLTVSISPPLLEMFSDEHLMERYVKYVDKRIELSSKETVRLQRDGTFRPLARFYQKRYTEVKKFFVDFLDCNVLNGFRYFRDRGYMEIITSCATHGLLPLLKQNERAVEAQISIAVDVHEKYLGSPPEGVWLPECAYYERLDTMLTAYDVKYFFLDTHGLMDGKPPPRYGVYAPVYTENGIAVFGRDPLSSKQVWSAREGYPGDFDYREFYRDAGFDLDFEYISPYINPDGARVFTGIKYYRITGQTSHKEPYDPVQAFNRTREHARHFYGERIRHVEELREHMDRLPVILSPYDAELFGHWWFEGPDFLYNVFREIDTHEGLQITTPSAYLGMYPRNQVISPRPTSWGRDGYYDAWLNAENDWVYRHLHRMADTLEDAAKRYHHETDALQTRLLNQLARELLLAQSSDWAFLITTNTAREYAEKRTRDHISNFYALLRGLECGTTDTHFLEQLERRNSLFPGMDFRVYAGKKHQ